MEVVFLLGSVQALFLAILVFNKKHKSTGDYVLGIWLVFIGLHLLNHYLFTTGFLYRHPHLLGIGTPFPLLEGPFMFVYVLVTISKRGRFRPVYLLHGIPFLLFTVYYIFEFYILSPAEKVAFYEQLYIKIPLELYIVTLPMIFLGPFYLVWSLIKLRRHSKEIEKNFSYTETISLRWLRNVLIFIGFVWVTGILANIFVKFPFLSVTMHEHLQYLALTIAVFFLGYFGIRQQAIYRSDPVIVKDPVKPGQKKKSVKEQYLHSGLKKADAEKYSASLLKYFKNERPFLNGKLSLNKVAARLEITPNHLSQVINEQLGMSFFDFVNSYRVEEFKSRLTSNEDNQFTLLGIAFECGFNSKSSFNTIFKKFTGATPSQFAQQLVR